MRDLIKIFFNVLSAQIVYSITLPSSEINELYNEVASADPQNTDLLLQQIMGAIRGQKPLQIMPQQTVNQLQIEMLNQFQKDENDKNLTPLKSIANFENLQSNQQLAIVNELIEMAELNTLSSESSQSNSDPNIGFNSEYI